MIEALPGGLKVWRRALAGWRRALDDLLPWRAGRLALWLALIGLVLSLLATLVWLAGRYEASQVQAELERDTQDAVSDLRAGLARDVQLLQGVQAGMPGARARRDALLALLRD
ncbi:MAG: PAS domain-containing sensor histidine kinase, partial [Limnohabitans sp.]